MCIQRHHTCERYAPEMARLDSVGRQALKSATPPLSIEQSDIARWGLALDAKGVCTAITSSEAEHGPFYQEGQ